MKFSSGVLKSVESKIPPRGENKNQLFATSIEDSSCATFTASQDVIPTKMDFSNDKEKKMLYEALIDFSSIEPEGALDFKSEFISGLFGTRNMVHFASFLTALKTSTTWTNTCAIISMYLAHVLPEDVADRIIDMISQQTIFPEDSDSSELDGEEDVGKLMSFWNKAKSMSNVYSKFKNTLLFKRLRDAISICVVCGIVDNSSATITTKALEIFNVKMNLKMPNIGDMIDLVFKTVIYFAEAGYMLFTGRGMELFEPMDIMSAYQKAIELWPICRNGNLMRTHGMHSRDYGVHLDKTIKMLKSAINDVIGPEKTLYMRMITELTRIKSDYLQFKTDGKLRQAPLLIGIQGDSSVAKSTLTQIFMISALKAMGRPSESERIRVYNAKDKYDSWADGLVEGLICDDIGALSLEYSDTNPSEFIIHIKNNAPMTATKADVDEKGKIPIDVSCVICTLNSFAEIQKGASCVEAVMRRFDIILRPFCKPEFRDKIEVNAFSHAKAIAAYADSTDVMNCWDFQIVEPVLVRKSRTSTNYGYTRTDYELELQNFAESDLVTTSTKVEYKLKDFGVNGKSLDTYACINYITSRAVAHRRVQEHVVNFNDKLHEQIKLCETCKCLHGTCSHTGPFCELTPEGVSTFDWSKLAEKFSKDKLLDYTANLAESFFQGETTSWFCDYFFRKRILEGVNEIKGEYIQYWTTFFALLLIPLYFCFNIITFLVTLYAIFVAFRDFCKLMREARNKVYDNILSDVRSYDFHHIWDLVRSKRVQQAGAICIAAVGLYKVYGFYKSLGLSDESALSPDNEEEANNRLAAENPWAKNDVQSLPVVIKSNNMTSAQLQSVVTKSLVYVTWAQDGIRHETNAYFIKSNYLLVPWHLIAKCQGKSFDMSFIRGNSENVNFKFNSMCNFAFAERIKDTDFGVVQIQNAPSFVDSTQYLLPSPVNAKGGYIKELIRGPDGSLTIDQYRVKPSMVSNNAEGPRTPMFLGSLHQTTVKTFSGRCMSVLFVDDRKPFIFGFHLGGDKKTTGVAGCLFAESVNKAIASLTNVLPEANAGTFPTSVCGIKVFESARVHPKCPTNFMDKGENNNVEVYGTSPGRATYSSDVVPTIVSPFIEQVMGVPNKWGPPKMKLNTKMHRDALCTIANSAHGFCPKAIAWAIDDYTNDMITEFKRTNRPIRPLTHYECVNGVPGLRFVNAMMKSSAIGYPRTGTKSKYFTELPPTELYTNPVEVDAVTQAEIDRLVECYKQGERAYPIARTALKDEVLPLEKEKVRLFYVLNTAQQYLIRKYFLMIFAAMSTHPISSGCAVGINRCGLEWEELIQHITSFGENQIFAGDYSKFDLRIPSQIIRAAFAVYEKVAKEFGYSDEDIQIMRGICADTSNPAMSWNGTLMVLWALHISGSSGTVYNGTVGSQIMLRCHYYEQFVEKYHVFDTLPPFRRYTALMGYGDDLIGGVSKKISKYFNHLTYAEFLSRHGMIFTMPDKTSEPTPLMSLDEVDFLKCHTRYEPALGHKLSYLAESSIMKSLHCVLKNDLSREEAAALNIDNAIREFFYHGREVYELRVSQLAEVARLAGIEKRCTLLDRTFDYWLENWKLNYLPNYRNPEVVSDEIEINDIFSFVAPECGESVEFDTVAHYSFCNGSNSYFWWEPILLIVNLLSVMFFMLWLIPQNRYYLPVWDKRWVFLIAYSSLLGEGTLFRAFVSWVSLPMLLNIGIFFRSMMEFLFEYWN